MIKFYPRCFDITSIDRCRQSLINNSKYINISLLIYPDIDDKNTSVEQFSTYIVSDKLVVKQVPKIYNSK